MSEGTSNRYVNSSLGFEPQPIKPKGATVTTTLSSCLNFMIMLLIIMWKANALVTVNTLFFVIVWIKKM